jgi:hypothetical protein
VLLRVKPLVHRRLNLPRPRHRAARARVNVHRSRFRSRRVVMFWSTEPDEVAVYIWVSWSRSIQKRIVPCCTRQNLSKNRGV